MIAKIPFMLHDSFLVTIPFMVQDRFNIRFEMSEYSYEKTVKGSNVRLGTSVGDVGDVTRRSYNELIDIDNWLIGRIDPHELGDISNV